MREIKISQETATRWYNGTDAELKALAVQTYPELAINVLPKTWEDLKEVRGYYTNHLSETVFQNVCETEMTNKNIFATEEQAEASIAMAQLSQLMKVYNDGWVPDFKIFSSKYTILFDEDVIVICEYFNHQRFLTLKDEETAELFLENFKDLIEIAKPLL